MSEPSSWLTRHRLVVFAALIVVVAVVVIAIADPFGSDGGGASEVNDGGTPLTMVVRESLSSQTASSGTLGFADSYSVINQASGTVTWLPAVGAIIPEGGVLPGQRRPGAPADRQDPRLSLRSTRTGNSIAANRW